MASNVGAGTYTVNIPIPATARLGQTLMRVMVINNGTPSPCLAGPFNGEVEDYLIFISNGTHCSNGVKDADETGVDCGGADCVPCTANYWPTNTGMNSTETDVSEDVLGNSWVSGMPVNAGETYYLLVNNWSPTGGGFDIIWNFQDGGAFDCSILPLELLDFKATNDHGNAKLSWTTTSEENVNYYAIMRSNNGILFEEAGKVLARNNSSSPQTYLFIDENYAILQPTYYQLKIVDYDGKITYSPVRIVYPMHQEPQQIVDVRTTKLLSENSLLVTVFGAPNEIFNYQLYTITGNLLTRGQAVIGENAKVSFTIPMQQADPGIYMLSVVSGNSKVVRKITWP